MARLISPFESTTTFPVIVELDEGEQSLALVTEDLLARAIADFTFDWQKVDGKPVLVAKARLRRRLLTSQRTKALRDRTLRVFEQDGGEAFADYLRKSKRLKGYQKTHIDTEGSWFAEIEHRFPGQDLLLKSDYASVNPGAFTGAFYFFHFVGEEEEQSGVASGTGASLQTVRDLAGISILRDGFQVRNRGDWLGLWGGMTSGSTYNLRPENTLGYFALSGEKNFRLIEKSDREGFVDNPAYRGFLNIARACRDFANDAIVSVRRTLDEYDKALREKNDPSSKSTEEDLAQVGTLADAAVQIAKLTETLEREVKALDGPQGECARAG